MSKSENRLSALRIDRKDRGSAGSGAGRYWLGALVLVSAALLLWFLNERRGSRLELSTGLVTVSPRAVASASVLDASGYVTARRRATVSSKLTGKVLEVLIEEGQRVEAGQLIARLDDSLAVRELSLAEAQLASARSRRREAEVFVADARRTLKRVRDLSASGVESEAALDAALAAFDSSEARLAAARDEVSVASRQVSLQEQRVEDYRILSPFDGIVVAKNAQAGEMISPVSSGGFTRTGIGTIVDMTSLEIEVDVNEAYINRVTRGQAVVAVLDAYRDWQIPAHVITTIPTADRQKATVRVRIAFEELGDPRILPDMGVKVAFKAEDQAEETAAEAVVLVPASAVVRRDGKQLVFVLDGEQVGRRAISVGAASGSQRVVVAGLRGGERVVLDPPEDLRDGDRVKSR